MWQGPGFVDHHTHLLRVSSGAPAPWAAEGVAAYHRRLAAGGTNPMDAEFPPMPTGAGEPLAAALLAGLERAAALGLCQITEAGLHEWSEWDALQLLRERDRLPLRVRILVSSGLADRSGGPAAITDRRTLDPRLEVEGVKFYADGWLGSGTCACVTGNNTNDTNDSLDPGVLFLDADTLARRAAPYAEAGLTVATHAIGDRAIETVLDAYDRILAGQAARTGRFRVEHAQLLNPELVDRMAALQVTACIQPSFAATDWAHAVRALGPARAAETYRWDKLLAAGVPVITGSDFPIEDLDPLAGLRDLVTGRGTGCPTLPLEDALQVMTDQAVGTTALNHHPADGLDDLVVVLSGTLSLPARENVTPDR